MLSLVFKVFPKLWYYLVKQANEHYINAALVISLASFKLLCVCACVSRHLLSLHVDS